MLAAVVKVSNVVSEEEFLNDIESSFRHKFANKPQVIPKNMDAVLRSLQEVKE
jgi:pyruvate ferredoxin oxidoreductase gamma subunit